MANIEQFIPHQATKETPDPITERINSLFFEHVQTSLEISRQRYDELEAGGKMTKDEIELKLNQEKKALEEKDFKGRMSAVMNNFSLWLPGNFYRKLMEDMERQGSDREKLKSMGMNVGIAEDIDQIIEERGYRQLIQTLSQNTSEATLTENNEKVIADIFLAMIDRGYSREELTA